MSENYDVIVVGARCAGSPTAMLLARQGYRVLMVDKATFPSDTLSTHLVHNPGMEALERWGLREQLIATGCPPVSNYTFDFGFFTIAGTPRPSGDVAEAYGPRRTIIDEMLVNAAADAGVEVRQGFAVDEVLIEDGTVVGIRGKESGGTAVTERAQLVVGADGRRSLVAKAVKPEQYNEKPPLAPVYYAYWSGVPTSGFEVHIRDRRGWGTIPTHDDLTLIVGGWPEDEYETHKGDVENTFMGGMAQDPEFEERVRAGRRETQFKGAGDLKGFFRKPFGPGWALVGDAGYHTHPITAMGMTDAFLDAERASTAIDDALSGRLTFDDAMAHYQKTRDEEFMPMYELTADFATLLPPPPEQQQLLAAVSQSQESCDQFVSVQAGSLPIPEFFAPENVERIFATAG
jgi:flavin-dependent dehydrogenase